MNVSFSSLLFRSIVTLVLAVTVGCSDGSDSRSSTGGNVPTPSTVELLPGTPLLGGPFFDDVGYDLSEFVI
ncbi:MAG: hypothetical protein ACPG1A_13955, partial [Halioglobus sp.]